MGRRYSRVEGREKSLQKPAGSGYNTDRRKEQAVRIHDISMLVRPAMVVWPGDDPPQVGRVSSIDAGQHCNVSRLVLGSHCGTHLDAPLHFIRDGAGIADVPLSRVVGPAEVIDCTGRAAVDARDLDGKLKAGTIPLLKTDSSSLPDTPPLRDYVCLTEAAARLVAGSGVTAVGIDYLSIAGKDSAPVHRILLEAGVIPIEGLRLASVRPGRYMLVCLPLRIDGCDGSPARAILIEGLPV